MPVVDGNIVRGSFRQSWDGTDEQVNVFHFRVNDMGTEDDADLLEGLSTVVSACFVTIEAHIANNVVPTVIDWYNVSTDAPLGQTPWFGGYSGGTGTGEALPTTVAALILFPTVEKRMQGRVYLPTMLEAAQADSVWTSTVRAAMADFATGLRQDIEGVIDSSSEYIVYSRTRSIGRRPTGQRIVPIAASMRSRRRGRGS